MLARDHEKYIFEDKLINKNKKPPSRYISRVRLGISFQKVFMEVLAVGKVKNVAKRDNFGALL